jgi:VWFA-related protein
MRPRWQLVFCLWLLFSPASFSFAQQDEAPPKPYVLHAYANLIQVPALALTSEFKPLPNIERMQFSISLDGGPAFHPTRMHIEGDETISLAVLIDASGDQDRLLHVLPRALAQLARTSLKPRDHVSILSLDCKLIRSALNTPADPDSLQLAVEKGLTEPALHGTRNRGTCGHSLHTWDAAARAIQMLADSPGRRVLVLVSTGNDHKSFYNTNTLRHLAVDKSVSIFAVRDLVRFQGDFAVARGPAISRKIYLALADSSEDRFTELCESTGGVIITLYKDDLEQGLEQLVTMLRSRYILEFPRPNTNVGGEHRIDVTIPHLQTFIVTTGVSVPLPDATLDADPNTIPSSPSPAILGNRKMFPHTP